MIEFEVVFNGTPQEFGIAVQIYEHSLRAKKRHTDILTDFISLDSQINPVYIYLRVVDATMTAHRIPNNRSRILVQVQDEAWADVEPTWKELYAALAAQGWFDEASIEQTGHPIAPADRVIETYYRRHARNPKITLKQVCTEMGADYGYIRKRKVAYDKRRNRGNKR